MRASYMFTALIGVIVLAAGATPAAAQGIIGALFGAVADQAVSTTLNQVAVGGGTGGFLGIAWRAMQLLKAMRQRVESQTVGDADDRRVSLVDKVIGQSVDGTIGTSIANGDEVKPLDFKQLKEVARGAKSALADFGISIDTDTLEQKAAAVLAERLRVRLGLAQPATPAS